MKLKKSKTGRGFGLIEFIDEKGVECSIQESSLATDECIWIGCDDADPRHFVPGAKEPWPKVELPKDAVMNTRMHLNRKQVKALLPILKRFVEKGVAALR